MSSTQLEAQSNIAPKGIQVSLLTCSAGQEIYSVFGHTALRIVDSTAGTDIVYNYGTFDGYEQDFEMKFMRGKLLYYLSEDRYADFIASYSAGGRWVDEQVLLSNDSEKRLIQSYLLENLLPENRAYKYDFFFDNCATRIRDIFTQTHSTAFVYPKILPTDYTPSFRDIINQYLVHNPWERMGINILLGSKIDRKMTNAEIMFLPDYLEAAVAGARLNGMPYVRSAQRIVAEKPSIVTLDYSIWMVLYGLLLCMVLGLLLPKFTLLSQIIGDLVLFITGLLGVLMLIMWFATDHQTCTQNFNLLWALPTNILFVFRKKQYKYALVAIVFLLLSFVLHLAQVQCLLLPEMIPIFLLLLITYARIYRKYSIDSATYAKNRITP
jgi:hypothetical protein